MVVHSVRAYKVIFAVFSSAVVQLEIRWLHFAVSFLDVECQILATMSTRVSLG